MLMASRWILTKPQSTGDQVCQDPAAHIERLHDHSMASRVNQGFPQRKYLQADVSQSCMNMLDDRQTGSVLRVGGHKVTSNDFGSLSGSNLRKRPEEVITVKTASAWDRACLLATRCLRFRQQSLKLTRR